VGVERLVDGFAAAMTGRDRAVFAALCAVDVHYEDPLTEVPVRGRDALGDHAARLWVAAPDARIERAAEVLTDGRMLAVPVRLTGTHTGELPALPATNRRFDVHGMLYSELDADRKLLWRVRAFFDLYEVCVQLGILPRRGGLGERALLMLRGFGLRRG
jgi:steroid delta-isomerase-like uncharacterized protein